MKVKYCIYNFNHNMIYKKKIYFGCGFGWFYYGDLFISKNQAKSALFKLIKSYDEDIPDPFNEFDSNDIKILTNLQVKEIRKERRIKEVKNQLLKLKKTYGKKKVMEWVEDR